MLTTLAGLPASAADSARAAASVYTASLLATAPIVAAAIGAVAMRRAAAEGRVLVWRVAVVMLLVALAGRLLPLRLAGWSVPSIVAAPLVALGRIRVADLAPHLAGHARLRVRPDRFGFRSRSPCTSPAWSSRCCPRSSRRFGPGEC